MSFFSFLALANASGPQGYQSTGLWACCRRYGLVCWASRLVCFGLPLGGSAWRGAKEHAAANSAAAAIRRIELLVETGSPMVGSSVVRGHGGGGGFRNTPPHKNPVQNRGGPGAVFHTPCPAP